MKKTRVLIVDDSMLIRGLFAEMLAHEPDLEVVGTATDPMDAREKIKQLNPDVVTLDVEMPKMDGITFLEKIMTLRPMPVVMVSSLTARGAEITLKALEIGAVDFITKPALQSEASLLALKGELAQKVREAGRSKALVRQRATEHAPLRYTGSNKGKLIAIGASTGGVEALRTIFDQLPPNLPPIIVTQHMPPGFTTSFAARLDAHCPIRTQEAVHLEPLNAGHIYIAPGDKHLEVQSRGDGWIALVQDGPLVSGHKPSVDVMFHSVSKQAGKRALGIILTGMGRDGADGLLAMRNAGARTIGQSEASCVVYGMPRMAKEKGAVEVEAPLEIIPKELIRTCESI